MVIIKRLLLSWNNSPGTDIFSLLNNEKKQNQFKLLYNELESQGAFYISPSAHYMRDSLNFSLNPNPWGMDGRKVEINKNYLTINPIVDINNKHVKITKNDIENEITVLVPTKFKKYENNIKETIANDYKGIFNEKDITSIGSDC
ncbi:hypothetical protein MXL46_00015 [Heyndrickxia sporothermodurans]|uniref:hypothetical protein n=1 Tax=Heyndrickxia sporothermodurans TaxID=46224 RepID=UPI002DBEF033|nr:hypothetical protein [Heyndrickxia sporothermodurans]MEB6547490.1 hypothetical protein [Heyndrickxia sporothermodurans]MED1712047.1 hypothetical protein [Bacillus thuringiensis]